MPCIDSSNIVNTLVRKELFSSQEVMGDNGLNVVLRNSGLERFDDNKPPGDYDPGILSADYAKLYEVIKVIKDAGQGGVAANREGILSKCGQGAISFVGDRRLVLKLLRHRQRIKILLNR